MKSIGPPADLTIARSPTRLESLARMVAAGSEPGTDDLIANRDGFYSLWAQASLHARVERRADFLLIASGLATAELNVAFLNRVTPNLRSQLTEASRFFRDRSLPWRLEVPESLGESIGAEASEVGLVPGPVRPGFRLEPGELQRRPALKELDIQPVRTQEESALFTDTLVRGMAGVPSPAEAKSIPRHLSPGTTSYLGRLNGEPIATAILYLARGVGGIYGVSTLEKARRRGIGRATTERAVEDGFRQGASCSFLQASPMEEPVYRAMGFRQVFRHAVWSTSRDHPPA